MAASFNTIPAAALTQQQRVLLALNRFTFGPRPGEAATVDHMGLDAWFTQQLHPERIEDSGLDARLAKFPAMRLSEEQLAEQFPTRQRLRQYSRGALQAPADPVERAIYADASFRYEQKLTAAREAKASPGSGQMDQPSMTMKAPASDNSDQGTESDSQIPGLLAKDKSRNAVPMDARALEAILALSPGDRMQRLLTMSPAEMQSLRAALRGDGTERLYAGLSPAEVEQIAAMQSPVGLVGAEATSTRLLRDVYSERQLQAVMTDFWLNHFSVYARKNGNEPYLLPAYERETILPHALGRFEDLLVATAQSPAMQVYLDNWTSVGPNSVAARRLSRGQGSSGQQGAKLASKRPQGINENYARELMELHTLGVNGGYTQADVVQVAKCFTGWTTERPANGGGFVFNPNRHEPGPKTVLGHSIPESGEGEGLAVLHLLAIQPATAHFLSLKLAQRFVSDAPPAALVDRMSAAYLRSDGDIATVLSTMFHSAEFWYPATNHAKVKTPLEFVASALRAGDAEVTDPVPLVAALRRLGMPLYGMQTPNGYGDLATDWVSSSALLTRMNFALVLAGNRLPGTHLDWAKFLDTTRQVAATPDPASEQRLETVILGENAAPRTRAAVLEEARDPTAQRTAQQNLSVTDAEPGAGTTALATRPARAQASLSRAMEQPETPLDTMAGLLLGSPDFQRR